MTMNNKWLRRKDVSLMQGDIDFETGEVIGSNLDIFYVNPVLNDVVPQDKCSRTTIFEEANQWFVNYYPMRHTPVKAGTMIGVVQINGRDIQTFNFDVHGRFHTEVKDSSKLHIVSASLNAVIGEITTYWNAPVENSQVVLNYEFDMG
jgi:hypothetical protein